MIKPKLVGGPGPPLWKIWKSIGMIRNPIYGKIKNGNQTTNQQIYVHVVNSIMNAFAFEIGIRKSMKAQASRIPNHPLHFCFAMWHMDMSENWITLPVHHGFWTCPFWGIPPVVDTPKCLWWGTNISPWYSWEIPWIPTKPPRNISPRNPAAVPRPLRVPWLWMSFAAVKNAKTPWRWDDGKTTVAMLARMTYRSWGWYAVVITCL